MAGAEGRIPPAKERRKGLSPVEEKEHDIVVYTTPFCAPCDALKRQLSMRGIPFRTCDIMMDEAAQKRLEALNIRSSPALEIDGEIYVGDVLGPDQIEDLLLRHLA